MRSCVPAWVRTHGSPWNYSVKWGSHRGGSEMSAKHSTRFTPADLIPEWWDLTVPDLNRLVWLGKITIREMIRYWRGNAQECVSGIKRIERTLSEIDGLTPETIRAAAAKHENPTFTSIKVLPGSMGDPEPTDAASINRKRGATTLNVCGWCKYASGG